MCDYWSMCSIRSARRSYGAERHSRSASRPTLASQGCRRTSGDVFGWSECVGAHSDDYTRAGSHCLHPSCAGKRTRQYPDLAPSSMSSSGSSSRLHHRLARAPRHYPPNLGAQPRTLASALLGAQQRELLRMLGNLLLGLLELHLQVRNLLGVPWAVGRSMRCVDPPAC